MKTASLRAASRTPLSSMQFSMSALAMSIALALGTLPQAAVAQSASIQFHIPAQSLSKALLEFGEQASLQIFFSQDVVQGYSAPALTGSLSPEEGLRRLLAGTGIEFVRSGKNVSLRRPAQSEAAQLAPIQVKASLDPTTEGTGSYTTPLTNTATKMNLSIKDTPQSISVITRQQIEDQQLNTMTDVLGQTPGVTMAQDGGQRFNIYSRGSAIDTYQLDGVTTTQVNQTRTMPSTLLDMALYDRVEVVRGATGLMTGAGSPSGTVNLIRKRPTKEFQAHVQLGAGSWDFYRAEADVSGPLTESGNLRGRLVFAKQDNNSFMDAYKQDKDLFYGALEADLTETTLLRLSVDHQRYKAKGAPGVPLIFTNGEATDFSRSTSTGARWMYDEFKTTNYTLNLEQDLPNDWQFKVAANYMDVDRDNLNGSYQVGSGRSFLDKETGSAGMLRYRAGATQSQKGVDVTLQGPFELGGRQHDFIAGFNFQNYENKHTGWDVGVSKVNFYTWNNELERPANTGQVGEIFNVKSRQTGAYAAVRFNPLERTHLIVGARVSSYDYDYYYASPTDKFLQTYGMRERDQITPYVGLVYDLTPEQTIYASYTDIFQPQSAQDRNGKVLDPIIGKNQELGWKGEFLDRRLNANIALYQSQKDNVAEEDAGFTVPGQNTQAFRSVDGAKTKGIDLELAGEITPDWNVHFGFSHSKTKDAQGEQLLTVLPVNTLRLWTTYRLPGQWSALTVGGGVNWNSKTSLRFSRYNSTVEQDSYAVVNLMARYQFNKKFAATLNVNNLFDKTYYQGMGGSYGHYGAPRSAFLNLRYDF